MAVKTATRVDPFDSVGSRHEAGVFGMWLLLVTLGVLFVAGILGYLVVRLGQDPLEPFVPEGAPPLPRSLLVSTLMLLASSATMHATVRSVRAGDGRAGGLAGLTLLLGLGFLAVQVWAWAELWRAQLRLADSLYAWTFYVLTALHALHVLGGLVAMHLVITRVSRTHDHAEAVLGFAKCTLYWHTLGLIWIALYATLWIGSFD